MQVACLQAADLNGVASLWLAVVVVVVQHWMGPHQVLTAVAVAPEIQKMACRCVDAVQRAADRYLWIGYDLYSKMHGAWRD